MNKLVLTIALSLISMAMLAQRPVDKGIATINHESAKSYIGFLASDALEGRGAGKQGGTVAGEYIKAVLVDMGIKPFRADYFHPFEAYSREWQKRVKYSVNPDSIAKYKKEEAHRRLSMRNVLGYIEGKRKDEFVIIGSHYDHIGMDNELVGDKIYNGADDNASGVSATLQIAKAFVASGVQPERSIIFAFWDGEEIGILGSENFILTTGKDMKIKGYLNFDMIGRDNGNNPKHVVYFYTELHPTFRNWLRDDIKKYKLGLEPDYRPWDEPVGGSDNGPFAKRNIPIIWYHTDGHKDYHQPSDHADKINYTKLIEITKAAYLNLWNLANEPYF